MTTITAASAAVAEGDRIKATNVPSVPHAEGRIATVTRYYNSGGAYNPDGLDFPYVSADFEAYTDDDGIEHDPTNWCVWAWEKVEDDLGSITYADRALLVGKRVRALEVNGYERLEGQEITVTRVHDSTNTSWTNGIAVYGIFDDNGQESPLWATKWEPVTPNLAADTPEVTALRAEITRLERIASEREATVNRLQESVTQAHRAFEVASGILIREANDRGWCEAYDNIIDEINGAMPGPYRFEEREAEYDVEVEISATVTYTTTVSVTARSQEQADEYVNDDPESFVDAEDVLRDNYRYVNVTIDSIETA